VKPLDPCGELYTRSLHPKQWKLDREHPFFVAQLQSADNCGIVVQSGLYSTMQGYFYDWAGEGRFASVNHLLVVQAREGAGRGGAPPPGHRQPVS
jgi:hypothetical protein